MEKSISLPFPAITVCGYQPEYDEKNKGYEPVYFETNYLEETCNIR